MLTQILDDLQGSADGGGICKFFQKRYHNLCTTLRKAMGLHATKAVHHMLCSAVLLILLLYVHQELWSNPYNKTQFITVVLTRNFPTTGRWNFYANQHRLAEVCPGIGCA